MSKVSSKAPDKGQIDNVINIEGIGIKYAIKLKRAGIKTTEDLRLNSLVEIVENTNISSKLVYRWQCLSDLFRLKKAAEEWTELLFEVEAETVKEVSKQDANDLQNKIELYVKKNKRKKGWRGKVKRIPSESDVKKMIDSAKTLVKKTVDASIAHLDEKAKQTSKDPEKGQVGNVIDIEGISKETAKDLKAVGIETTEQLRRESLVEIVEATNLSPKRIYKWQCLSDLFRVKRIAEEYSDLLLFAGIQTVKEVSRQKIRPLYNRVKRFAIKANKEGGWAGDIKKLPSKDDIKQWIVSAKELVKK